MAKKPNKADNQTENESQNQTDPPAAGSRDEQAESAPEKKAAKSRSEGSETKLSKAERENADTVSELADMIDDDTTLVTRPLSIVGQTFGDYEIIEEIGRGSMGVVYTARQKSLDRVVALKMMASEHFHNPVAQARFATEALAVAKLGHPNIIDIYQVGECHYGHYFAMEYVEGETLDDLLKKGPVALTRLLAIIIHIAEAVDFAHNKGIIHRDLKPANIMIDRFGRPIIMDFGIARMAGSEATLTQRGMGLGTPAFMAPEQAGDGPAKITKVSDVYALGAILYTAVTGRPPFHEENALRTLVKVVSDEPPPAVRQLNPDVPEELEHICMKCLEKKPENRYPSAWSLAKDVRRLHKELKRNGGAPSTVPSNLRLKLTTTGKLVSITRSTTTFGRSRECDVVLNAPKVSKKHCQIILAEKVFIEDLDSSNGTFVNGKKVQRSSLKDGDELGIAGHLFQVLLN